MKKRIKLYIYITAIMGTMVGYAQQKLDYSSCQGYELGTGQYHACVQAIDEMNKLLEELRAAEAIEVAQSLQTTGVTLFDVQAQIQTIDLSVLQEQIRAKQSEALAAQQALAQAEQALTQAEQALGLAEQEFKRAQETAAATGQMLELSGVNMAQNAAEAYVADAEMHARLAAQQYAAATGQGGTPGTGTDTSTTTWYMDNDGDGWHSASRESASATCPGLGWCNNTTKGLDCDDTDPTKTYDCSDPQAPTVTWFLDKDGDGYFAAGQWASSSPGPGWTTANPKGPDCDDTSFNLTTNCTACEKGKIPDGNGGCKPDPCLNSDLRHKKIIDPLLSQINSRTQPFGTPNGVATMVKSFEIQEIENGYGNINLDRYSLDINNLPDGYTPQQLFEEIRTNFYDLITGGDFFWEKAEFMPYAVQDINSWSSSNPIGSAMDFDTLMDTATVICTEYSNSEMYWVFTTVHSVDHLGHPVSGHRWFGIEENGNGSYSFVVRGADRLTTWVDSAANVTLGLGGDFAFDLADRTWKNLMETIEKYINSKPGGDAKSFDKNKEYAKRYEYNIGDCSE
ncbi:hypothetical protein [Sinomicrobium sp. M5D2P9]